MKTQGLIPLIALILLLSAGGGPLAQTSDPLMDLPPESSNEIRNAQNTGVQLFVAGDNAAALAKFLEVIRAYPNCLGPHLNAANAYEKLGKMSDSISELETTSRLSPDNPRVLFGLGRAYSMTGSPDKAIRQYERYMWLYPNEENAAFIKGSIDRMKDELRSKDIFADSKGKDNYLEETLSLGAMRWKQDKMPIPVFISSGAGVPGYYSQYSTTLQQSFMEWAAASGGVISFKQVNSPDAALIDCSWIADRSQLSNPVEGGETTSMAAHSSMHQAKIKIVTTGQNPSIPMNLKCTCLHEVGHALGLLGHSSDAADIMYMQSKSADNNVSLTARDKKTLQALYAMPEATLIAYANKVKPQTTFLHDEKSAADKADRFNKDGIVEYNAGNYLKAAQLFASACQFNPTFFSYAENAGNSYLKLGHQEMKAQKFIAVQQHFELAAKYFISGRRPDVAAEAYEGLAVMAKALKMPKDATSYEQEANKMRLMYKH